MTDYTRPGHKKRTAAKRHSCYHCGVKVEKGEHYMDTWDANGYHIRYHMDCYSNVNPIAALTNRVGALERLLHEPAVLIEERDEARRQNARSLANLNAVKRELAAEIRKLRDKCDNEIRRRDEAMRQRDEAIRNREYWIAEAAEERNGLKRERDIAIAALDARPTHAGVEELYLRIRRLERANKGLSRTLLDFLGWRR